MNNDSVIKLVKAGLSDDLIVSTINASPGTYNTSVDGIIALKTAGVSDRVVSVIVAKAAEAAQPALPLVPPLAQMPPPPPAVSDTNDPASPHDPGIYLMTTTHDGKSEMVFIDRAGSGNQKTSGVMAHAFTYGIVKAKMKAELPGPHATVRSMEAQPVFYMYFPPATNQAGLGGTDMITSPSQFELLSLEIKNDHRETAIAKVGFASYSMGNDEKRAYRFNSERIRPYVYKLSTSESLKAGEYAFIATTRMAGTAQGATVVIYDFGVDLR
jgi:hypothetical protein